MSDLRLREAERRWRATGSPVDRATWLIARVRSGDLSPARLRAASLLGDPGATLADPWGRPEPEVRLFLALHVLDAPAWWVRACLAALPESGSWWPTARWACAADDGTAFRDLEWAAAHSGETFSPTWGGHLILLAIRAARHPARDHGGAWDLAQGLLRAASEDGGRSWKPPGWPSVLGRVRGDLVPVLLGEGDPLRDRVLPGEHRKRRTAP